MASQLPPTRSRPLVYSSTLLPNPIISTLRPRNRIPATTRNRLPILRIPLPFLALTSTALPSLAAETGGDKIDLEATLVAIDDFFNRYPFFVSGVTFVWLAVIPLVKWYLKKCKSIPAIEAFRKLRDLPGAQLLDIRGKRSLRYIRSPNLKFLNKVVVQVEFVEGQEEDFVKEVMARFPDPAGTVLCVLDSFGGESLKVAELLFKNGFKEAYALQGGLRGKDGWQAIQETLLPLSMHVYPRKKKAKVINGIGFDKKETSDNGSINHQPLPSSGNEPANEKSNEPHGKLSDTSI